MKKVDKECKVCGKIFMGVGASAYCSDQCRKISLKKYQYEYCKRFFTNETLIKKCLVCNKEFIPTNNQVYCSVECRKKMWKSIKSERSKQNYVKHELQKSGEKHIHWNRNKCSWTVEKIHNGKLYRVYGFKNLDDAIIVRDIMLFNIENNTIDEWYYNYKNNQ